MFTELNGSLLVEGGLLILSLPFGEIVQFVAVLLVGGAFMGFIAGLLGIGGGAVLVPILYELFRILGVDPVSLMHVSVATSLAVIIPTSIQSARKHDERGAVDRDLLRDIALPVVLGVLIGTVIAKFVPGGTLKAVYIGVCTFVASKLISGEGTWQLGTQMPEGRLGKAIGMVIGILSTLIGVGGGAMMTSYMTLYGRSIHRSVATSAGLGPIIAVPATLGYVWAGWNIENLPIGSLGYVSLLGAVIAAPASVLTAPIGVSLAHGISRRALELSFAAFLIMVAIRFFSDFVF